MWLKPLTALTNVVNVVETDLKIAEVLAEEKTQTP